MKPDDIKKHITATGGLDIAPSEITGYKYANYERGESESEVLRDAIEHRHHVITIRKPTYGVVVFWCLTCDSEVLILR